MINKESNTSNYNNKIKKDNNTKNIKPVTKNKGKEGSQSLNKKNPKSIPSNNKNNPEAPSANSKMMSNAGRSLGLGYCPFGGDPVNLITGNYVLQTMDLYINGCHPLYFTRTYNSISNENTECGSRWSHNHQVYLINHRETIEIHTGFGGLVRTFNRIKPGVYKTDEIAKESFQLLTDGYLYKDISNQSFIFNRDGFCIEIKGKNGNKTEYTYCDNLLSQVQNIAGALTFTYNKEKKLTKIQDHAGRTIDLLYDGDNLIKVSNLLGGFKEYKYDSNGWLIEEISPYGIKKVINEFDKSGRTIKQIFPDGGYIKYEYDDEKTAYILQNGSKMYYYKDKWGRNCNITSSDSQTEKKYNVKHQLTEISDYNGNMTCFEYDSNGNMILIKDPASCETRVEYDRSMQPVKVVYPDGSTVKSVYNKNGQVVENIDQLNRASKYQYYPSGMLESIIHPDGSKICLKLDDRGNITEIESPFHSKVKYEYDLLNRVTASIDGNGNKTNFIYNQNNDLIKVIDALGNSKIYNYNRNGKITEIIDQNKNATSWEYNDMGCLVKKIDSLERETLREYDLMWNMSKKIEANGAITKYQYDKSNHLEKVMSPEGGETSYQYDKKGNVSMITFPDGMSISYHYDILNRLVQMDYPDKTSSYFEYNFSGKITKVTDPMGGEYLMEYDAAGQRIKQADPSGNITCFEYNELGLLTKIIEPLNRITEYRYYIGGRLKSKKFPDGSELHYSYDSNGNILRKQIRSGYWVEFDYDALNRITSITNSKGQSRSFCYDAVGNLISVKNQKGLRTDYEYSKSGALNAVIDSNGIKTFYEYNEVDRIIAVKQIPAMSFDEEYKEAKEINEQKELLLVKYRRNLEGHVVATENAAGDVEEYQRDYFGRILSYTDPEGIKTQYAYDTSGNLSQISYPDGKTVMMEYNALNQLIYLKDWLGSTKIQRNISGMPEQISNDRGELIQYQWNVYGDRTRTVYPDGKDIRYEYDDINHKIKKIQWDEEFIDYSYNEDGYLTSKQYSNNQRSDFIYDIFGQVQSLNHSYNGGILKYEYEYDLDGQPIKINKISQEGEQCYEYHYDDLNRLTEVVEGLQSVRSYEYDSFGNRSSKREGGITTQYYYNELRQLIQEEREGFVKSYEYDKKGNINCWFANGEKQDIYHYNASNLLERVEQKDGHEISYIYDGFGQRTMKQRNIINNTNSCVANDQPVSTVEFLIDYARGNHNLIGEKSNGDIKTYIWEPHSHQLSGVIDNDDILVSQNDHLGTPVQLINQRGMSIAQYDYDEFGNPTKDQFQESNFGFTGYYYESDIGLYYAAKRYYNSDQGLFYGIDSDKGNTCEPMSLHPYLYCLNNPLALVDLDGARPGAITHEDGTEAHQQLEKFFMAKYAFYPGVYPSVEKEIPGGNPKSKSGDGQYDMVLEHVGQDSMELYELKPYSHYKPTGKDSTVDGHQEDLVRYNHYIEGLEKANSGYDVTPGTTFNPDGLELDSPTYSPYYKFKYYTYYNEGYKFDGKDFNYKGFIYWSFIRNKNDDDNSEKVAIPKDNSDKGSKDEDQKKDNVLQFPEIKGEDVAAAAGGAAAAYLLWQLFKWGVTIGSGGTVPLALCPI